MRMPSDIVQDFEKRIFSSYGLFFLSKALHYLSKAELFKATPSDVKNNPSLILLYELEGKKSIFK